MQGRFSLPYRIVRYHVGIRDSVDDCRTWPLGKRYEAPLRNIVQWLPSIEFFLDARYPSGQHTFLTQPPKAMVST